MATIWTRLGLKRRARNNCKLAKAAARAIEALEPRQLLSAVVTTYPVPNPNDDWSSYDSHIVAGPGGNFWFTDSTNNAIGEITPAGKVTEFPLPVHNVDDGSGNLSPDYPDPTNIAVGSDGNIWFVESGVDRIGKITPAGVITEFTTPTADSNPTGLALGADGDLWFGETASNSIGRIAPDGAIKEFPLNDYTTSYGDTVAEGSDGNIWFLADDSSYNGAIGTITPAGKISFQPIDGSSSAITAGPDGNLWVADGSAIEQVTTAGTITTFNLPDNQYNYVNTIHGGTDGNVYFSLNGDSQFGKITPAGVITEYSLPNPNNDPMADPVQIADLTQASDGRFWYVDSYDPTVGVINLNDALLATGASVNVTAGSSQTSTVGSFIDLSGTSTASDYTATLTLSDGSVIDGVVAANSNGGFDVSVTNSWAIGYNSATLNVTDSRDTTRTATATTNIEATAPQAVGAGVDISATAGQTFNGAVATFTNVDLTSLSSYSAQIEWGDGHVTAGTITANSTGGVDVTGTNDYAQSGMFTVSTTLLPYNTGIFYPGGPIGIVPIVHPIVSPGIGIGIDPIPGGSTTMTGGGGAGSTLVGFASPTGGIIGTGNSTVPVISGGIGIGASGTIGSGTAIRTLPPIFFNGNSTSTATSKATVAAGVMQGAGYSVQASSTKAFSDDVASFTLADPNADLSHFHATVTYTDPGISKWFFNSTNAPSAGVITSDGNGGFTVSTATQFTQPGLFHFVVTISDDRLGTGTAADVGVAYGQVIVDSPNIWLPIYNANTVPSAAFAGIPQGNAATTPTAAAPTNPAYAEHVTVTPAAITAKVGNTFSGAVGSLKGVVSSAANLGALHGTINWGDGTSSTASFVAGKKGKIVVDGSHMYTAGGAQPVTVDINQTLYDKGQATTLYPLHLPKIVSAARVASVPFHAITTGALPVTTTTTAAFAGNVATFTAPTVSSLVTRTATVLWGDRTHSTATIAANGNILTISGSHFYKKAGKYKVRIEVVQTAPRGSGVKVPKVLALIKTGALVT